MRHVRLFALPITLVALVAALVIANPVASYGQTNLVSQKDFYQGLPLADVQVLDTPKSVGTVILIPQFHQIPGTQPSDPQNDTAEKTQGEISQVIDRLTSKAAVKMVMVEGEQIGDVNSQKLTAIDTKVQARDRFAQAIDNFNPQSKIDEQLVKSARQELAKVDRSLALKGAPYLLRSRGTNLTIVGAETPTTQLASRELMQKYFYLNDRIKQVDRNSQPAKQQQSRATTYLDSSNQSLLRLLSSQSSSSFDTTLSRAKQSGASQLGDIETSWQTLKSELSKPDSQPTGSAPDRNNNPYATITDPNQLKTMASDIQNQMNDLVITQRSHEAATNFATALSAHRQNVGILQFGAGHTDQLISELQHQGLDVVILTSTTVAQAHQK